jgi:drug/metabolite transporter (DMT)-like permease
VGSHRVPTASWLDGSEEAEDVLFAVSFGLASAFLFAASASIQQHAARQGRPAAADGQGRFARKADLFNAVWQLIRRLIRTPLWLFGWLTNLVGYGVQAIALHFGTLALVQPLQVTQLLFALPLASAWQRRWPVTRDWVAAFLISGGLAIFLAVRGVAPLADNPDRSRLLLAAVAAAGAVMMLLLTSAGMVRSVRSIMIATAAGLCYAVSAAMIKLTVDDLLYRGVPATARDWPGYALAAFTIVGLLLGQASFATGSLPAAVATMSITNPIASYLLGVFAFGAQPPNTVGSLAALSAAGALICSGAVGLTYSPIVRRDSQESLVDNGSTLKRAWTTPYDAHLDESP